jgi:hypothetical protein
MSWIEFCRCHRRILTSGQQKDNKPCELCQKENLKKEEQNVKSMDLDKG